MRINSLKDFVGRALEGKPPEGRELLEDCVLAVVIELGNHYFDGTTRLGVELRALMAAAGNRADPMLAGLSRGEKAELWVGLKLLKWEKERRDRARQKEAQGSRGNEKEVGETR